MLAAKGVPTLDERVALLEEQVKQAGGDVGELRTLVVQLDAKVDRRIDGLDGRFDAIDRRFEAVDRRFDAIDRRFEAVDQRFATIDQRFAAIDQRFAAIDQRFAAIDRRFHDLEGQIAALDQKLSRQFLWTMGVLTTVFVSVIGTLLGVVLTLD